MGVVSRIVQELKNISWPKSRGTEVNAIRSKTKFLTLTKNKKRSQNNCLESHVWSRISEKPVERKIWNFLSLVLSFHILTCWKMGFVARVISEKKKSFSVLRSKKNRRKILLSQYLQKEVRIIVWRAMFGVKYLENPWWEQFDFFSKNTWGSIFWHVGKWKSWLESFKS